MNAGELFDQLGIMGARELIHVLDDLPEKLKHSIPQNQEEASYAEKLQKTWAIWTGIFRRKGLTA